MENTQFLDHQPAETLIVVDFVEDERFIPYITFELDGVGPLRLTEAELGASLIGAARLEETGELRPHRASVSKSEYNWGASGDSAVWHLAMQVTQDMGVSLATLAVQKTLTTIAKKTRRTESPDLEHDAALHAARQRLILACAEAEHDSLRLVGEEELVGLERGWRFVFEDEQFIYEFSHLYVDGHWLGRRARREREPDAIR